MKFLIFLLGFLSLGAFVGAVPMIIQPDGSIIQLPNEILEGTIFSSFLIPAFILLIFFGITPILLIYALIKKPESKFFEKLNLLPDHHFAWTFTIYVGMAQVMWISIQTLIIQGVGYYHVGYTVF